MSPLKKDELIEGAIERLLCCLLDRQDETQAGHILRETIQKAVDSGWEKTPKGERIDTHE